MSANIKDNWQSIAALSEDVRTADRIDTHYKLEKTLAKRLMDASIDLRKSVYAEVYNQLFAELQDHPQKARKDNVALIERQVSLLKRLVPKGARYAEIGAGDGAVCAQLCDHCKSCIAIDVSESVFPKGAKPENFRFMLIDGINITLPDQSVDFVYSNQLMEHLHPDDAKLQLDEIFRILAPGGIYYCVTPNINSGPHDISKYFDENASGFHLVEYSYKRLTDLFLAAGFRDCTIILGKGLQYVKVPAAIGIATDRLFGWMFAKSQRPILNKPIRNLLGIRLIGHKPSR